MEPPLPLQNLHQKAKLQCMEIITREAARAAGLKRFFTGKPCRHGHVAERYVSGTACVECAAQHDKRLRADPEYRAEKYRFCAAYVANRTKTDPEFRARRLKQSAECMARRYASDPVFRAKILERVRARYYRNKREKGQVKLSFP